LDQGQVKADVVVEKWANWAGNQTATCTVVRPRGTGEIAAAVRDAAAAGARVKPIGAGHSFTAIGRPDDARHGLAGPTVQLVLDRHSDLVRMDVGTGLVTVQAGMPLHRLNRLVAEAGLALSNLGDIEVQTVAGALSTGTHGTGARFGGLATQLRELELVLADGRVLRCSATEHPEVFGPARIGLGALGVVSTLTLQAEPAFALRAQEFSARLPAVLADFDELAASTDHFEFYWFPHTDRTLVKRNNRRSLDEGLAPLHPARAWWDDEFLSNTVFGALIGLGRRAPGAIRTINRLSARALSDRTYTDRSHRVFTSPRRVRFVEMEYAVPRAAAGEVIRRIRDTVERSGWRIAFPVEVRVAAADDIPLSTASGRASAYVAVHSPVGVNHDPYFAAVEAIAGEYGGRPHWGKLHGLDAATLRERYPRFEEFTQVRDRLDPEGRFANAYLDRVLGPQGHRQSPVPGRKPGAATL
jgi:FAD-linked oxidoreductase